MSFTEIEIPSNKKFGFFFGFLISLIALYLLLYQNIIFGIMGINIAIGLFLISFLRPNLLLPLNKFWMKLGLLLGKIVNPFVLGSIFFIIFTPVSLFFKLIGRDELKLKVKNHDTYWIPKKMHENKDFFNNQF